MGLVTMSEKEFTRLRVIEELVCGNITPRHAAQVLQLTTRQIRGLRRRFLASGPAGLASRRRGKPSNRTTPAHIKDQVLEILRAHYSDFGPTLASQSCERSTDCHLTRARSGSG
jgi:transposase